MQRIAQFYKVSKEQFEKDFVDTFGEFAREMVDEVYENIELPERASKDSAGYDFKSSIDFVLKQGESIKIPTGIRCSIDEGWFLMALPRSGLGFKYRVQLDNTVGIIDGDYFYADNEGHIFLKITNDCKQDKVVDISKGDRFAQGIFTIYGITKDDACGAARKGGLGSTGK